MISRNWQCLNPGCREIFHSYDRGPRCPKCGCVRVDWVPGGGHLMTKAPSLDKTIRSLADQFGFTNLNSPSPSRLNRAAPAVPQPKIDYGGQPMHFARGFSSPISAAGSTCAPSSTPMNLHGKVSIGAVAGNVNTALPFERSASIPRPAANTVITARTTQRKAG